MKTKAIGQITTISIERNIHTIIYAYIALPIALWLFFWFRYYISIPSIVLLGYGIYELIRTGLNPLAEAEAENFFTLKKWWPSIVIVLVWVLFSGIGGMSFQNVDFDGRNAIFGDLVHSSWPVKFDYSKDLPFAQKFGQSGLLNYYFAFWLPAALVGKAFGWGAANFALYIWTCIGAVITVYLLQRLLGKIMPLAAFLYVLWSGADIIGYLFLAGGRIHDGFTFGGLITDLLKNHKEWWSAQLQYSSFSTQLYWVFNQSLPTWIITFLMLLQKSRKCIVFLCFLMIPYAPLPFVGALLLLLFIFLFGTENLRCSGMEKIPSIKSSIKEMLSIPNLACVFCVLPIGLFFTLNTETGHKGFIFERTVKSGDTNSLIFFALWYFFFCLLEFGLYALLLRKHVNKLLLGFCTLALAIVPLFYFGRGNDFCMRASIPFLCILALMTIYALGSLRKSGNTAVWWLIVSVFILGSFTPASEIYRSVSSSIPAYLSGKANFEYNHWKTFSNSSGGTDNSKMTIVSNYVVPYQAERYFEKFFLK